MDLNEAMSALQAAQSESCKKTYLRHGAKEPLFGVRTADLTKIQKRIKVDHSLAHALVTTGNADARILGFLVADPAKLDIATVEGWLSKAAWPMDTYYLGLLLSRSTIWLSCMTRWMAQSDEWVQSAGYCLLAQRLKEDPDSISDDLARNTLKTIAADIGRAKNRARYSMNTALIAIGTYKPTLRDVALAVAERIGPVDVDHGDTDCKTPVASEYIRKAGAHADRMALKKQATRKSSTDQNAGTARSAQLAASTKKAAAPRNAAIAKKPAAAKKPTASSKPTAPRVGRELRA